MISTMQEEKLRPSSAAGFPQPLTVIWQWHVDLEGGALHQTPAMQNVLRGVYVLEAWV
jgi:hypothetical protein